MIIKNFLYKVLLACFFTMSSVSQINTYQGHYIKLGHSMKSIVRMGSAAAVRVAQKAMQNKLAQRAWDVKYSLVGAALFSNEVFEITDYRMLSLLLKPKPKIEADVFIPAVEKKNIEQLFAAFGYEKVIFQHWESDDGIPNMSVIDTEHGVILKMNTSAQAAYAKKDVTVVIKAQEQEAYFVGHGAIVIEQQGTRVALFKQYFTPEHMHAVMYHELGHVVHRHTQKRNAVMKYGKMVRAGLVGTLFVQGPKLGIPGLALLTAQLWAAGKLTGVAESYYCRSQEWQADEFALRYADKKMKEKFLDLFQKIEIIKSLYNLDRQAKTEGSPLALMHSHPSFHDRMKKIKENL